MGEYDREIGQIQQKLDDLKETTQERFDKVESKLGRLGSIMDESLKDKAEIRTRVTVVEDKLGEHLDGHKRFYVNVAVIVAAMTGLIEFTVMLLRVARAIP